MAGAKPTAARGARFGLLFHFGLMVRVLDASLAILNGVLGDYLAKTDNGLATPLEIFASAAGAPALALEHEALRRALPAPRPRLAVFVHGLMSTESIWEMPGGSDYGQRLATDLGMVPLYVRYNTGRLLTDSGAQLSTHLGRLVAAFPAAIEAITLIGHSMGGLVIRAACHMAHQRASPWLPLVRRAIYLGTPHLGSPLERAGRVVTRLLNAIPDPYTRMVAELADLRSRGIKDLGDGFGDPHNPIPLLAGIQHYLVAGHLSDDPWLATVFGDALVPVASATNGTVDPRRAALPPEHVRVVPGAGHLALARDPTVYECIRAWCEVVP